MTQHDTTITDDDIRALMAEAGEHGDQAQVILCRIAIGDEAGDEGAARAECERVILAARAER